MATLAVQPGSSLGPSLSLGPSCLFTSTVSQGALHRRDVSPGYRPATSWRLADVTTSGKDDGQPLEDRPGANEDEADDTTSLLSVREIVGKAREGSRDRSIPSPHMGRSPETAIVIPADDDDDDVNHDAAQDDDGGRSASSFFQTTWDDFLDVYDLTVLDLRPPSCLNDAQPCTVLTGADSEADRSDENDHLRKSAQPRIQSPSKPTRTPVGDSSTSTSCSPRGTSGSPPPEPAHREPRQTAYMDATPPNSQPSSPCMLSQPKNSNCTAVPPIEVPNLGLLQLETLRRGSWQFYVLGDRVLLQVSVPMAEIPPSPKYELQNASSAVEEDEGQKKRRRISENIESGRDSGNVGDVGERSRSASNAAKNRGRGRPRKAPFEGRTTRTRKIRAPRRAPGDELQ